MTTQHEVIAKFCWSISSLGLAHLGYLMTFHPSLTHCKQLCRVLEAAWRLVRSDGSCMTRAYQRPPKNASCDAIFPRLDAVLFSAIHFPIRLTTSTIVSYAGCGCLSTLWVMDSSIRAETRGDVLLFFRVIYPRNPFKRRQQTPTPHRPQRR
jgi:hypothetical protein